MSHTPGPWEIMESANALVVMGANSKHVVIVPLFREHEWNKEEWEGLNLEEKNKVSIANTRLIAAAPELYEMLSEVLSSIERVACGGENAVRFRAEWIEEARAVCAKVRGDEGERR